MSEFKGTRGEWLIENNEERLLITCNNPNWDIVTTITDLPQDKANAKLISCAPELLEFIQSLINESEDIVHSEIKKQAQQLIKKATEL